MLNDFSKQIDVFVSTDMMDDYPLLSNKTYNNIENSAGIIIFPNNRNDKMKILFSFDEFDKNSNFTVIAHELSHINDFLQFAQYYCNNNLYEIENHPKHKVFTYWSEFHSKICEIIYTQYILAKDYNNPFNEFKKDAKTFFYPTYTNKFNIKNDRTLYDVLWYFGEIVACNLIDNTNTYDLPDNLKDEQYLGFYTKLYALLSKMINFEDFICHSEKLFDLLCFH